MPIEPSLHPALLHDVSALNRRFIALLIGAARDGRFAAEQGLTQRLSTRLSGTDPGWPDCPFLLFRMVRGEEAPGSTRLDAYDTDVASLVTVTLGFVWNLAREHRPAARAVTGTDDAWCDALAAMSIAALPVLSNQLSLRPRLVDVPGFWQDLARQSGISALQRASLGATGMQLIHARARRDRVAQEWSPGQPEGIATPAAGPTQ
ncbi:MAG: hypothetical protein AAF229_07550 [Pseudomonadota bacterium]